jgi:hypothetical protein
MRWNAAVVEMDRYFKTPVLYVIWVSKCFAILLKNRFMRLLLQPIYGDEAKTKSYNSKEFGIRNIRTIFPFFILLNNEPLTVDKVKKTLYFAEF